MESSGRPRQLFLCFRSLISALLEGVAEVAEVTEVTEVQQGTTRFNKVQQGNAIPAPPELPCVSVCLSGRAERADCLCLPSQTPGRLGPYLAVAVQCLRHSGTSGNCLAVRICAYFGVGACPVTLAHTLDCNIRNIRAEKFSVRPLPNHLYTTN